MRNVQYVIDRLRALPRAMLYEAGPSVADAIHVALNVTANAGQTPDGIAWPTRKHDHGRALEHAAEQIRVGAIGTKILIRVLGVEARHHRGIVKGGVARRIILYNGITLKVAVAINRALTKAFREATSA